MKETFEIIYLCLIKIDRNMKYWIFYLIENNSNLTLKLFFGICFAVTIKLSNTYGVLKHQVHIHIHSCFCRIHKCIEMMVIYM